MELNLRGVHVNVETTPPLINGSSPDGSGNYTLPVPGLQAVIESNNSLVNANNWDHILLNRTALFFDMLLTSKVHTLSWSYDAFKSWMHDTGAGEDYVGQIFNDAISRCVEMYANLDGGSRLLRVTPSQVYISYNGLTGKNIVTSINTLSAGATGNLTLVPTTSYANDAAAATGGVPVNGFYHTAGAVKMRLV